MRTQTLTIQDWLPEQLANSNLNRFVRQKRHNAAMTMVWAAGKQAGLQPMVGRVKLTVTLVFGNHRRRDTDNLYSRCKGLIDGLVKGGWIPDDNTDVLELVVKSEVHSGLKATVLLLEPVLDRYTQVFGTDQDRDTAADVKKTTTGRERR